MAFGYAQGPYVACARVRAHPPPEENKDPRHPYPARVVGHGRLRVRDGLEMALAAVWPPVFVGDA
eukprot:13608274-Alexandrium_andersonii.AAC.1